MRVTLLGPVQVWAQDRRLDLGPRRRRFVFAVLALEANRAVSADRLIDLAWAQTPPPSARATLYDHIYRIRACLAGADPDGAQISVRREGGAYLLRCDPLAVDAHLFRDLVQRAVGAHDDEQRISLLERALGLWHGPALAGTCPEETRSRLCAWLEEAWLTAAEDRAEALLRRGRHHTVIQDLTQLLAEHPCRHRATGLLMRALHRDGHTEQALRVYQGAAGHLAGDLGLDPPPELQRLQLSLLRNEPADPAPALPPAAVPVRPVQLPPDVAAFVGRTGPLRELDRLLGQRAAGGTAVVISAVSGTAGVGKTALAVHWAHQAAGRFPDGQLYLNLRGFGAEGLPLAPEDALRQLLESMGMPPEQIPAGLQARAGMYRSRLAGKRVLVLLDNAIDAGQVRPLLPGSPGCFVVITSRQQLTSLVAAEGAQPITLGLLSGGEARQLLDARLGRARTAAEPQAAAELIGRCARLPLALVIAASHAATNPELPLTSINAQLGASTRLDTLDAGDPVTNLRTVFSWSYRALTAPAARLFRLLGLHPGPDITAPAAASLTGQPVTRLRMLLAELSRATLITEPAPGRYAFHDLLRSYATELGTAGESSPDRHPALHRLLGHYLHSAFAASRLLNPHRETITLSPPAPGTLPEEPADYAQAMAWFRAERQNLLAAVDLSASAGYDDHTWQLAWTLCDYLDRHCHWSDWARTQQAALAATRRTGNRAEQARAHQAMAVACVRLGRSSDAHSHLHEALHLYRQAGDHLGQARNHVNLASLLEEQGRHAEALEHARQARSLFHLAGDTAGQARALNTMGWIQIMLGDHQSALASCQSALRLHEHCGDGLGQAFVWDSLGYAYRDLGDYQKSITCYQRAVTLFGEFEDRYNQADTLEELGNTQHHAGDLAAARNTWQTALTIFESLRHPRVTQLRAGLDRLPQSPERG